MQTFDPLIVTKTLARAIIVLDETNSYAFILFSVNEISGTAPTACLDAKAS